MYLEKDTLDDLLYDTISILVNRPFNISSSRGNTSEIIGVMMKLNNPRARLSRSETKGTIFSALGELIWYLSGSNRVDHISYYINKYKNEAETDGTIYGAYGPRLFGINGKTNQIQNVILLLKERPTSRRAVIQLFEAKDLTTDCKEIPCTCTLQFFIRDDKLHLHASMRSNDVFWGLPHDIFAFTMIQEIFARSLSVDLGDYFHSIGSLHLYQTQVAPAKSYLSEGYQSSISSMPEMPLGDPWNSIKQLVRLEEQIRLRNAEDGRVNYLDDYWEDFLRLLKLYSNRQNIAVASAIAKEMKSNNYNSHIAKRIFMR